MNAYESMRTSWAEALAPLRQRWAVLESREQRALGILAVALVVFALWGLWAVLHGAAVKAEARLEANRALLGQIQRLAPSAASMSGGGASVLRAASDAAAAGGLSLGRIEPEGDGKVRVWLEKADFNAVARWLATLSTQGIRVEEAQVEKMAEGGVSARVALAR
ncbi:MAG TPA: type II secretion system protein M [Moraxellaceae bacterium]|nr:type II secretion system protein M [Moraxellaceae bacterium]